MHLDRLHWSALCAAFALSAVTAARADNYAWDPSGLGGGTSYWRTSLANWDASATSPDFDTSTNTYWVNSSTAWFGGTPGTVTLGSSIAIASSLNFTSAGYTIATGNNSLQVNGGGTGTALIDFTGTGGGTLLLRSDAATTFNFNLQAVSANATVNFDHATAATGTTLALGDINVGAARSLFFMSPAANNCLLQVGAVTNAGSLMQDSVNNNGVVFTGAYAGSNGTITGNADFGLSATDVLESDGTSFAGGADGTLPNGLGGFRMANASTSYIGTLKLGVPSDARGGNFIVDNGSVVHVTKSLKIYRTSNATLSLIVRQGSQLVIDAGAATGYNAAPSATHVLRAVLSGDGNAANRIEFAAPALDLGAYFYPNGNSQANAGGTLIGGLNLVTHGSTWTLYGDKGLGIRFGDIDGGGWTVRDNPLTVSGTGAGAIPATVIFDNHRFLDVQSAGLTFAGSANFNNLLIRDGKTVTKKGPGTLTINVPVNAGRPAGYSGAGLLAVESGTVNLNHATFNAALNISGGTVHVNGDPAGTTVLSSLTITGSGNLDLRDNSLILNYGDGPSPFQDLRDLVKLGHAGVTGITSSVAADQKILAIVDNAVGTHRASFGGVTLDGTTHQILGRYTFYGDANLDGQVTSADYTYIDSHMGQTSAGTQWCDGDFNQDGQVTSADYTYIDTNFGQGTGTPTTYAEEQSQMIALHTEMFGGSYTAALEALQGVPEPASLTLLGFGAVVLLVRRRSERSRYLAR